MLALLLLFGLQTTDAGHPADWFSFVSPVPGGRLVSPQTTIILRAAVPFAAGASDPAFLVIGSVSGAHNGRIVHADDGVTTLFLPSSPFAERETVRVAVSRNAGGGESVSYSFTIRGPVPPSQAAPSSMEESADLPALPRGMSSAAGLADSVPADFPQIDVLVNDSPAPGNLFMGPLLRGTPRYSYLAILDPLMTPVFHIRRTGSVSDFGMQPNGLLTFLDVTAHTYYAMDPSGAIVDSFRCGNGYTTDGHDLRLMPNGHALLMAYDQQVVDMRQVVAGGDSAALVSGAIVQEIDAHKNVVFEWRSWDHFSITDATHLDFTAHAIDYAHINAFDIDYDGNILLSLRHMDEVTKISRTTGEIIWRLGGKNNQFTFLNDTAHFSYQHDIRRIANGNITLLDNGNFHTPPDSRAVEYRLDEQQMTAELVWQFRHVPALQASATGNVQRQPNGNTLISWGGENVITEARPDGSTALEVVLSSLFTTYRTLRYPWSVTSAREEEKQPVRASLLPAFPNPFNSSTTVGVELDRRLPISLALYNILGQRVATVMEGWQDAGRMQYRIARGDLASGVYFLRLTAGSRVETARVVLLR